MFTLPGARCPEATLQLSLFSSRAWGRGGGRWWDGHPYTGECRGKAAFPEPPSVFFLWSFSCRRLQQPLPFPKSIIAL